MFRPDYKYTKCPRALGDNCLVLKCFYSRDTCNAFVNQVLIDGAKQDGNV